MISLRIDGLDSLRAKFASVDKQVRYAAATALNATAFSARADVQQEMRRVFDEPTPYILSAPRVTKKASPTDLAAVIEPKYPGGKGVDPVNILRPEVQGGARKLKRAEVALQRVGILPRGLYLVPAKWLLTSDKADDFGNVKGSFIVQLISYLRAFGEQGYRANMTDKRKARLAKRGKSPGGFARIGGVEYFVVNRIGQHLAQGIWQRSGTHGGDTKPVFLFARRPRYQPRLDMVAVAGKTMAREFAGRFRLALNAALASAR
jgi:hypothetical protein